MMRIKMHGGESEMGMPPYDEGDEEDYQAACDVKTLLEAERIKADKDRMKAAVKKAKEQRKMLEKVNSDG